jgi:hypothetical protein
VLLLLQNVRLDVVEHISVVRRAKSTDWIPSLGAGESIAARRATVLGTDVVAGGDVVEAIWASSSNIVQKWVKEA